MPLLNDNTKIGVLNEYFPDALNKFALFCSDNGIKLMMVPPAFRTSIYSKNVEPIRTMFAKLKSQSSVPVISTPENYVFDDSEFFEGVYHLSASGRDKRTTRLIKDLQMYSKQESNLVRCTHAMQP